MATLIDLFAALLKFWITGGDRDEETQLLHNIIRAANDEIARRKFGA